MTTVPTTTPPMRPDHVHDWREIRDHSGVHREQCTVPGCGRVRRTCVPAGGDRQAWGAR